MKRNVNIANAKYMYKNLTKQKVIKIFQQFFQLMRKNGHGYKFN